MKKRVIISLIFVLFSISLISAAYECSDGGQVISALDEISVGKTGSIDGMKLGLRIAHAGQVTFSAELIVDANKFSIDSKNSTKVKLVSGEYTIKIINVTGDTAELKIGSDSDIFDLDDNKALGDLTLFLLETSGSHSSGVYFISAILGKETIVLDNNNPKILVNVAGRDYALELVSTSGNEALIKSKKCENREANLIEIVKEEPEPEPIDLTPEPEVNDTEGIDNQTDSGTEIVITERSTLYNTLLVIGIIVAIIVVVFLIIRERPSPQ